MSKRKERDGFYFDTGWHQGPLDDQMSSMFDWLRSKQMEEKFGPRVDRFPPRYENGLVKLRSSFDRCNVAQKATLVRKCCEWYIDNYHPQPFTHIEADFLMKRTINILKGLEEPVPFPVVEAKITVVPTGMRWQTTQSEKISTLSQNIHQRHLTAWGVMYKVETIEYEKV